MSPRTDDLTCASARRALGLQRDDGSFPPGHNGPCNFERAFDAKRPLVEEAAINFLDRATGDERARFQRFAQDNISWLTDWAMFAVLRRRFNYSAWIDWPDAVV